MKCSYLILIGVLVIMLNGCEEENKTPDAIALVNNEQAFAETVAKEGMRSGFLKHMADSCILFLPEAVNGVDYYTKSAELSGLLSWRPEYAEIASGGEMGWTTGPWEYQRETESDTVFAYGHYITIWKMQPDSVWKLVLDIGISHDQSPVTSASPELKVISSLSSDGYPDTEQSQTNLIETERAFSLLSSTEGIAAAYLPHVAGDLRYYREGAFPLDNIDQVKAALKQIEGALTWQPSFTGISNCGTMGYTYGTASLQGKNEESKSSYVHIWRKNDAGDWQLSLDIRIPISSASDDTQ